MLYRLLSVLNRVKGGGGRERAEITRIARACRKYAAAAQRTQAESDAVELIIRSSCTEFHTAAVNS